MSSREILGMRVDATSYDDATARIIAWARARASRYVCVAAVNNVMVACDDPAFRRAMREADLVTPDGMPLVWGLRRLGIPTASRVYGPSLTASLLDAAQAERMPVALYGGSPQVLGTLLTRIEQRWPAVEVVFAASPPFHAVTSAEDERDVARINSSGAGLLLVGLGCPKQERWMHQHRDRIAMPMIGVGAAFDFLAGIKAQAPPTMQRAGLEWLFRLATEPRRLWRRYLTQNPRFVVMFARQLAGTALMRTKEEHS